MSLPTTTASFTGGTTSTTVNLGNLALMGVFVPTLSNAASISVQVSSDGGVTWLTMVTDNQGAGAAGAYTILPSAAAGGNYVAINDLYFNGVDTLRFLSSANQGSVGTPLVLTLRVRQKA